MQVFFTDGKQPIKLSLEKNKGKKLRNRNSNYTAMSNPVKKKEERDLKETSLTTGTSQLRLCLKITCTTSRRREVNSKQIQEWSELIHIGSGCSNQVS